MRLRARCRRLCLSAAAAHYTGGVHLLTFAQAEDEGNEDGKSGGENQRDDRTTDSAAAAAAAADVRGSGAEASASGGAHRL